MATYSAAASPAVEKKHWWLTNTKIVEKYMRDAKALMGTSDRGDVISAISLLDAALSLSPRQEQALELKARSLILLRRFRDVADMLQDYIPSRASAPEEQNDLFDNNNSSREQAKLLPSINSIDPPTWPLTCFSVSNLKRKLIAGLSKNSHPDAHWRYLVLGQACCHLGLMEDALVLLQTGKRLANAALRRQSVSWSEDSFNFRIPQSADNKNAMESDENISHLINHVKFLLRRRTAAHAALDAGLHSESIRHFSKIVDGRRGAPQGFMAECYNHRALAYHGAGRIAESISDCNRALALDPASIHALSTRASLHETIRCLTDSLHDLEHLRLLYNTILRDRKLPGPAWKRHRVTYREIPGMLCALTDKIDELKKRVASGETRNFDYYGLIGVRRGCLRSDVERAYVLLCLRHNPEKAVGFVDRCELADEVGDPDLVRDRAKMSALLLYRLIQRGYSGLMSAIVAEEEDMKKRQQQKRQQLSFPDSPEPIKPRTKPTPVVAQFQGVFCRDISAVSNLICQVGFNRPLPLKYEGLMC